MKTVVIVAVIAAVIVAAAVCIQMQNQGKEKSSEGEYPDLVLKTSFEVNDQHAYYDSVNNEYSTYTVTAKDPTNPDMYTVDQSGTSRSMSYNDIKQVIAPDLDYLSKGSKSFNKTGTTVINTKAFGDLQCDQYRAVFGSDTEDYLYIDYCITPSGVVIQLKGTIPKGSLVEYCLTLDSTTMVVAS